MSTLRSVILCCTACSFIGQAQAQALSREHIDDWLKNLGASDQFDASKGIDWGVMPGPFYTPELGLGIGTAIVGMYRPDPADTVSQNSTLTLSGLRQFHRRLWY